MKQEITDKELIKFVIRRLAFYNYVVCPGYDTWIKKENIVEHLDSMINDLIKINGKLDAIEKILTFD